jgi:hypothetical protein
MIIFVAANNLCAWVDDDYDYGWLTTTHDHAPWITTPIGMMIMMMIVWWQ